MDNQIQQKKEPIRVLHVLHSMNGGGAETMIMNYYRHMDRSKVQFDFLLTVAEKSDYEDEILALGGRIYRITPLTLRTYWQYQGDLKDFFTAHPEYKIVHAHTSSKSVFVLKMAEKTGIEARISHCHSVFKGTHAFSPKEMVRKLLRGPLKRVSQYNFACSVDAANWLYGEKYVAAGKVSVMKNAIALQQYAQNDGIRSKLRQSYQLEDCFVMGHVGRFREEKNHAFLLEIFKEVQKRTSKAKLVLVGDGPNRQEIEEKVNGMGLTKDVLFLGQRQDVHALLQMFDAFVFPSLYEGLGIVLVEAQAAGLWTFASKDVIPQEVQLTDHLQFISLQAGAKAWAESIIKCKDLVRKPANLQEIAEKGYDIRLEAQKMEQFYLGLI